MINGQVVVLFIFWQTEEGKAYHDEWDVELFEDNFLGRLNLVVRNIDKSICDEKSPTVSPILWYFRNICKLENKVRICYKIHSQIFFFPTYLETTYRCIPLFS